MDITTDGPKVVLSGEFDVRSTSQVRGAIYDVLSTADHVLIDMSGVEALDVVALRVLLVATRQAWLEGRQLTLLDCSPSVLRMIHLARVGHAVEIERRAAAA